MTDTETVTLELGHSENRDAVWALADKMSEAAGGEDTEILLNALLIFVVRVLAQTSQGLSDEDRWEHVKTVISSLCGNFDLMLKHQREAKH